MGIQDTFLSNEDIEHDENQINIVNRFEKLQKEIIGERRISGKILSLFRDNQQRSNGIYLWGDVGRGKTFLMDLFFESLTIDEKDRKHFHRLMEEIHNGIKEFKDHPDPINRVANSIASKNEVLCIDEFYVEDIADATIMARLIKSLLDQKIRLIITSNCKPDDLYKNGLQRDLFIPAINQINQSLEITHIGDGRDYRQIIKSKDIDRISIHNENSMASLARHLECVIDDIENNKSILVVRGREIECIAKNDQLVWFNFESICGNKRSVKDYIDIADQFKTVVITNVPLFNEEYENEARRFVALIDELYDRDIDLYMTASRQCEDLYHGKKLQDEFRRTTSRLVEMSRND
tara:strand:+ start:542 stop:1591 length:1050 start_codon:yes stop_codon:yes gene_type:complete